MNIRDITCLLDQEFRIRDTADAGMTKHALSEVGRALVSPPFHLGETGLMFDFADSARAVYCTTFLTSETIARVLENAAGPSLILTHHPFDYHEDHRGLSPVPDESIAQLRKRRIAVYAIHAPLDVGLTISVSKSLASRLHLMESQPFYSALGGHLGVHGRMEYTTVAEIADALGAALTWRRLTFLTTVAARASRLWLPAAAIKSIS